MEALVEHPRRRQPQDAQLPREDACRLVEEPRRGDVEEGVERLAYSVCVGGDVEMSRWCPFEALLSDVSDCSSKLYPILPLLPSFSRERGAAQLLSLALLRRAFLPDDRVQMPPTLFVRQIAAGRRSASALRMGKDFRSRRERQLLRRPRQRHQLLVASGHWGIDVFRRR